MDLREFCNYIKSNIGRLNRDNYMKLQLLVSLSKMDSRLYIEDQNPSTAKILVFIGISWSLIDTVLLNSTIDSESLNHMAYD